MGKLIFITSKWFNTHTKKTKINSNTAVVNNHINDICSGVPVHRWIGIEGCQYFVWHNAASIVRFQIVTRH